MTNLLLFPIAVESPSPAPPDAAERVRALDIARSFVVEAPAGSGKTGLLIQRFLKLLATVDDPAQVLAITFTRKATSELIERVLAALRAAGEDSEPANDFDRATHPLALAVMQRDKQRGWGLLDQPARLNIRTIDAVAQQIAAALPVLSGSGGGLKPADDTSELYAAAARRTLSLLGDTHDDAARNLDTAIQTILLHRDGHLADCEALIADMLGNRDQWGELLPLSRSTLDDAFLDDEVLPRLERALDLVICRSLTVLSKLFPASIFDRLCTLAAEMGYLDGYRGNASPLAICAGKSAPPQEQAAHLNHWLALISLLITQAGDFRQTSGIKTNTIAFMIERHHRRQLGEIIDGLRGRDDIREALIGIRELPPAEYPRDQWKITKALFIVLGQALAELQLVFAESGRCDFTELSLLARTALRSDSGPADLSLAESRLQHLLVDEMQDTSSIQYELLQLLTERWDGFSQTVFLVGDPKQSIYLFRQARVERFVEMMRNGRFGDLPLDALHLTANFRSQRTLVEAFNKDFAQIFPAEANPLKPEDVPYREAAAVRPAANSEGVTWRADSLPNKATPKQLREQRNRHANEICNRIKAFQARPLPSDRKQPWKIAILVSSRSHLIQIVAALKDAAIPYRAVQIEPLAERREILDLLALTRALQHLGDRTAWLAVLRTPWVGLTLADLHLLAGADERSFARHTIFELIEQRGDLLSVDGIARLQLAWPILRAALAQHGRLPLAQLIQRTLAAFKAQAFLSAEQQANGARFLGLIDELESSVGMLDLSALKIRLTRLYAAPVLHPGAVDVMTIHEAKGLEWDLVFVPALDRPGRGNDQRLFTWTETGAGESFDDLSIAPGIIAPIRSKGAEADKLDAWIRGIERARETAERKRLYYVACTRAREELHLFAAPERNAKGKIVPGATTLLAAAWPVAKERFPTDGADEPQTSEDWSEEDAFAPLSLAASAGSSPRIIERIPAAAISVASRVGVMDKSADAARPAPPFTRPEGSFAARAFGNTLHALLELSAQKIAAGATPDSLLAEVAGWQPRISALLRSAGLPSSQRMEQTANVLRGLTRTLESPEGRWLLAPHPQATSESARVAWRSEGGRSSIRLDRTFLGGDSPHVSGSTHLWIIDYKTTTHAEKDLDAWLMQERTIYKDQLETYAVTLAAAPPTTRVGLFYPMLARLIWWQPGQN